jgi:hypothetical protein
VAFDPRTEFMDGFNVNMWEIVILGVLQVQKTAGMSEPSKNMTAWVFLL